MLDGGLKKKKRQDKGLVDEISAGYYLAVIFGKIRNISYKSYDFTSIFIWTARAEKRG